MSKRAEILSGPRGIRQRILVGILGIGAPQFPLSPMKLAEKLCLPPLTVSRHVRELQRMGVLELEEGKVVSEGLMVHFSERVSSSVEKPEMSEYLKNVLAAQRQYHSNKMQREVFNKKPRVSGVGEFIEEYRKLYDEVFGEEPRLVNKRKVRVYFKRPLEWCAKDFEYAKEVLQFLFYEWEYVKRELKLSWRRPTMELVGTFVLWERIRELREKGRKRSVKNRYTNKEEDADKSVTAW